jgi:hypothetical protein
LDKGSRPPVMAGEVDENIGLLGDFCSDQPLPNPLPGRCAGFDLRPMSFGLDMMSVERKHHPGRQVVAPGDHHCRAGSQQFEEHRLRVGSARVIDDDNAQVLDQQSSLRHLRSLDDQLAVSDGEPCARRRELHRLANHNRRVVSRWRDERGRWDQPKS